MERQTSDRSPFPSSCARTALILLAAGNGRRFGSNKLMARIGEKKVYEHMLDKLEKAKGCLRVCVSQYDPILEAAKERGMRPVKNDAPDLGISHSIGLGLKAAIQEVGEKLDAAMFLVADQPMLRQSTVEELLRAFGGSAKGIAGTRCAGEDGHRGNPAIFDRKYFRELLALSGDKGGRQVLMDHPDDILWVLAEPEELMDIDTPGQLNRLNEQVSNGTIKLD